MFSAGSGPAVLRLDFLSCLLHVRGGVYFFHCEISHWFPSSFPFSSHWSSGELCLGDWRVNEKMLREVLQNLPERSTRDKHTVPWDSFSIDDAPKLLPAGCGLESACAKSVVACTARRVGINATANRRIVCARCGGGRRPNANVFTGDCQSIENGMPRPRLNGGATGRRRRQNVTWWPARSRLATTARGHAARCLLGIFVIGPDAMNPCLVTRAPRHGTAVVPVGKPCDELLTANVSG